MIKMNAGAWIGLIGGLLGIAVGIAAVIVTAGSMGIYIVLLMLGVLGLMGWIFYKLLIGPMLNTKRLMKVGIPAKARILAVKDTGVTINNQPQIKLVLEIRNTFGQRYETTVRTLVSRINPYVYQPGMELPVRIDPKNEKNVVIDFDSSTRTQDAQKEVVNEPALRQELEALQTQNEAIKMSGRPARALIKKNRWLGVHVNGKNPYTELEIEVLPENAAAFSSIIRCVIAEGSVDKYQPGSEIKIKYDYYDNSKSVIDQ